jgi:alanine racemase
MPYPQVIMPANLAGATATIDLAALKANYLLLARKAKTAETAAAIKGDAYGLGVKPVAKTLWAAGCRSFYVARPEEGGELRAILPTAKITVLDGLYFGETGYYRTHNLTPALATAKQAEEWARFGAGLETTLHVDTGINRIGLDIGNYCAVAASVGMAERINVTMLMSHLACADEPLQFMNALQLQRFKETRRLLPDIRASFANSSGIFLGAKYHFDEVRPGIALYGGNPTPHKENPMKPVAHLHARILQIRDVAKGQTVGYSATWKAKRNSRIAIIAAGYADGIARKLSSTPKGGPAQVYLAGQRCPVVGRVSMDMMTIDVTDVSMRKLAHAQEAELFGKHIPIDEAAGWAGTISYELLTHLGKRYARVYSPAES